MESVCVCVWNVCGRRGGAPLPCVSACARLRHGQAAMAVLAGRAAPAVHAPPNPRLACTDLTPPRTHPTPAGPPRSNITIPATFVTKSTGDALKALLQGGAAVYVSMDWTDILPKKQQVGCGWVRLGVAGCEAVAGAGTSRHRWHREQPARGCGWAGQGGRGRAAGLADRTGLGVAARGSGRAVWA